MLEDEDDASYLAYVHEKIETRDTIIFGAGPSLESDLDGIKDYISRKKPAVIAADGAAEALVEVGITADIVVSDLDSCPVETLIDSCNKGLVFVHGHGDNHQLVRAIVPQLACRKLGTTQVEPRQHIRNFGGFTDGDRACFIAAFFKPSRIVLAGMDFGDKEGRYSVNRYNVSDNPRRVLKLQWGKKSLEYLIQYARSIKFQNVTRHGMEVEGAGRISYEELI